MTCCLPNQKDIHKSNQVWTTSGGNLGVAKFLIPLLGENDEQMKIRAENEKSRWEEIWNVKAMVVTMLSRSVLLMPFAFHIRYYQDGLQWCSINSWNHRVESLNDDLFFEDVIKEDEQLMGNPQVQAYLDDPLSVAAEALRHMIMECGWKLMDQEVCWRHVALLPTNGTVKPIILDLTRCEKISDIQERSLTITIWKLRNKSRRISMPLMV